MCYGQDYLSQVELLVNILPIVNRQECFALKGGTAINLFVRNMPRLSVDIDLVFLPLMSRHHAYEQISQALDRIADEICSEFKYLVNRTMDSSYITKLQVNSNTAQIIIEPNHVIRGTIFPCNELRLCNKAEELFYLSYGIRTCSLADLYGGKICAALARQHPRDLFDVKLLLENEGLTDDILTAFVIYLASSSRPMHELLTKSPNLSQLEGTFASSFHGMTDVHVTCDDLKETRILLIQLILESLSQTQKQFLVSVKQGEPIWSLIGFESVVNFPSILWKTQNIKKMSKEQHSRALKNLITVLEI
jgi:predicted nucleotidyltransferase component of viral defense system